MAKDKRIGELPGISASAVVGLNRVGIVSIHDLLSADFDRVAYIVDDYNEAARLVREAKKHHDGGPGRRGSKGDPNVPSPLVPKEAPTTRTQTRSNQAPADSPAPQPAQQPQQRGQRESAQSGSLTSALSLLAHGLSLAGEGGAAARATLARRLTAAATLLDEGATETELLACAILEPLEAGAIPVDDLPSRFGEGVESILDECTALRAVPMMPTGKPPRYYMDMAREASRESRRVCAAHLLASLETGPAGLPGGAWYGKLLMEGLEAAGPEPLVAAARAAMDEVKREVA
jgi:hypothetical protein